MRDGECWIPRLRLSLREPALICLRFSCIVAFPKKEGRRSPHFSHPVPVTRNNCSDLAPPVTVLIRPQRGSRRVRLGTPWLVLLAKKRGTAKPSPVLRNPAPETISREASSPPDQNPPGSHNRS